MSIQTALNRLQQSLGMKPMSVDSVMSVFTRTIDNLRTVQFQLAEEALDTRLEISTLEDSLEVIEAEKARASSLIQKLSAIVEV